MKYFTAIALVAAFAAATSAASTLSRKFEQPKTNKGARFFPPETAYPIVGEICTCTETSALTDYPDSVAALQYALWQVSEDDKYAIFAREWTNGADVLVISCIMDPNSCPFADLKALAVRCAGEILTLTDIAPEEHHTYIGHGLKLFPTLCGCAGVEYTEEEEESSSDAVALTTEDLEVDIPALLNKMIELCLCLHKDENGNPNEQLLTSLDVLFKAYKKIGQCHAGNVLGAFWCANGDAFIRALVKNESMELMKFALDVLRNLMDHPALTEAEKNECANHAVSIGFAAMTCPTATKNFQGLF